MEWYRGVGKCGKPMDVSVSSSFPILRKCKRSKIKAISITAIALWVELINDA